MRGGFRGDKDGWTPLTKLGRLVKAKKIQSLEEVYTHSIPIKEAQITETLIKNKGENNNNEL